MSRQTSSVSAEDDRNEALEIVLAWWSADARSAAHAAARERGNWSCRDATAAAGYRGSSILPPPGGPPCRITLGSTPKKNIRPRMMRMPRMPMPPPRPEPPLGKRTPPPGKGKPKPPPSSRRSSTFSLSLSPRHRMASSPRSRVRTARFSIIVHAPRAGTRSILGAAELLGLRGVKAERRLRVRRHAL